MTGFPLAQIAVLQPSSWVLLEPWYVLPPNNVILVLSLWTEPGAASLLCQAAKIVAEILQGTGPMPG